MGLQEVVMQERSILGITWSWEKFQIQCINTPTHRTRPTLPPTSPTYPPSPKYPPTHDPALPSHPQPRPTLPPSIPTSPPPTTQTYPPTHDPALHSHPPIHPPLRRVDGSPPWVVLVTHQTLGPRPSNRTSSSEAEAAADSTPASTTPWLVMVSGSSLRAALSMLLIQLSKLITSVSPGSSSYFKSSTVFQESQSLLCPCFPCVRVTVAGSRPGLLQL
ncbi:unnamed protein product [Arctogadus glacialis]